MPVHDRGRVLADVAVMLADGGEAIGDIEVLRHQAGVLGPVASAPTVWRSLDEVSGARLKKIQAGRARTRRHVWAQLPDGVPASKVAGTDLGEVIVLDVDATIVIAHSEKEKAAPTFKRSFGFHPLGAWCDNTQEFLAAKLRPGNAGSNTAADHIEVLKGALAQLPDHRRGTRRGRRVLIRIDGAGSTHTVLDWLTNQRLSYSVGYSLPAHTPDLLEHIPEHVWAPAYDAHDAVRDGAWVAELTDLLNLTNWPKGMRVIVRKERPRPGAQLTITDIDGHRITAFATNTRAGGPATQLADLELRHRRRARCEDRIRIAKDTGLRAFPLFDFAQNEIWCQVVALAVEITAWMQMLALTGHPARR